MPADNLPGQKIPAFHSQNLPEPTLPQKPFSSLIKIKDGLFIADSTIISIPLIYTLNKITRVINTCAPPHPRTKL